MSEHLRAQGGTGQERQHDAACHGAHGRVNAETNVGMSSRPDVTPDEELIRQITQALRSRESAQLDVVQVSARLEAALASPATRSAAATSARRSAHVPVLARRGGRAALIGVLASGMAMAGAGAAAAANPYSGVARTVEGVVQAVGIDWSLMPEGYTREQYEAFWDAGYTYDDVLTLDALWNSDDVETKARAGQMILDGEPLPILPSQR